MHCLLVNKGGSQNTMSKFGHMANMVEENIQNSNTQESAVTSVDETVAFHNYSGGCSSAEHAIARDNSMQYANGNRCSNPFNAKVKGVPDRPTHSDYISNSQDHNSDSSLSATDSDDDISPSLDYEDNEDLESTIRKLRQLLEQQKTDDNSSCESAIHPMENTEKHISNDICVSKNPGLKLTCEKMSSDEERNIADVENAPTDGRLFFNVWINDVETLPSPKQTTKVFSSNTTTNKTSHQDSHLTPASSLLFSISYDAIYIEECLTANVMLKECQCGDDNIQYDATADCGSSNVHDNESKQATTQKSGGIHMRTKQQSNNFEYIVERQFIKRKFHEFVQLQKGIENKISLNSDIWSLRDNTLKEKNSSWLNNIHSRFSTNNSKEVGFHVNEMVDVDEQKQYLEKWLIDICGNSTLCHAPELKEFLGYPSDTYYGVARKSSKNTKIDKVLILKLANGTEPSKFDL